MTSKNNKLVFGYENGIIEIYDKISNSLISVLTGHESSVTCLDLM